MGLEKFAEVDAITTEGDTVVLAIFDTWDWADEREHLLAIQEKLNAYLGFIESGELARSYPDAKGRKALIRILQRDAAPPALEAFLVSAREVAARISVTIATELRTNWTLD